MFLRPLSVTTRYDDFSQALNVVRKKDRVVEQQLVAIVTVDRGFPLESPRALDEDAFALAPSAILRSSEQPLSHVVVSAGIRAPKNRGRGIKTDSMKSASTKLATLYHVVIRNGRSAAGDAGNVKPRAHASREADARRAKNTKATRKAACA